MEASLRAVSPRDPTADRRPARRLFEADINLKALIMRHNHKNHIGSPCRSVFAFPFVFYRKHKDRARHDFSSNGRF